MSALLSVQEGCNKFCTFCVVPYTRGGEFSRPVIDVYNDAKSMAKKGIREIVLLGQNVNGYHGDNAGVECSLGALMMRLNDIDGIERIRYTTSHPIDMHDDLYKAHASSRKVMPFLNLPVQSGSDRILKSMNRKYSAQEYIDIINKLRQETAGDIAISSDFIVGFPGETEKDFECTMDLVETSNTCLLARKSS
ncbi:tRNA-2-methylthio-N(6)-dimethylallyladenosine synthase-like [Symsagittifera roscoffensis]|uniref:tRNA-2-methylthio-N(6)-dimethylallyladenosine synthase-like n=1 Tax=Symsagittifera roscoffensis TaxID=84072 RepID=UPI00307BAB71